MSKTIPPLLFFYVCLIMMWMILFVIYEQCESHGIPLPTLEEVDTKAKQFNEAQHYMYNEEDIDKVWKLRETSLTL